MQVPFEKDHVKEAPQADPDVQLSREEEDRLYDHYGMSGLGQAERREPAGQSAGSATVAGARAAGDAALPARERAEAGAPQAAATTDTEQGAGQSAERGAAKATEANRSEDVAMTRSEEEVTIGKQRRERGRARLKKYVVTDYVEKKVPIQREEVRLEYEPAEGTGQPGPDRPPAEPA